MSRLLTIDIGNTAAKGTVFEDGSALEERIVDNTCADILGELGKSYGVTGAAICNVRGGDPGFAGRLEAALGVRVLELTRATSLPIEIVYSTPQTLGVDRIAAATGAAGRFGEAALVVDAGTAVTADIVEGMRFSGGNISPGLRLRFRSLHEFTGGLPLVRPEGELPDFGHDTATAIRSGVVRGLVAEISAEYEILRKNHPGLRLVMTGGDADFLAPLLREGEIECIVCHDLVGLGLERIYKYNENE